MKYRRLGKTGMKVSVIGVGTWQFGGEWGKDFTQEEASAMLGKAKELGINFIDTAECYGDHLSESLIGGFLAADRREDWVIATKFGHHFTGFRERTQGWTPDDVVAQLDASLKALRTDYIDLYQFHSGDDAAFDNDALWSKLQEQVQAGKIRHLGISISSNRNIHQTSAATKVGAEAMQVVYNRLDQAPEEEVFPSCIEQDLGVLARVPLASGYLSGKYKPGTEFTGSDVRAFHERTERERKLKLVEEIAKTEVPSGVPMAQWALAWCLQHPAVTVVIPGCKDVHQVVSNAAAAELVSDDHQQAWKG